MIACDMIDPIHIGFLSFGIGGGEGIRILVRSIADEGEIPFDMKFDGAGFEFPGWNGIQPFGGAP